MSTTIAGVLAPGRSVDVSTFTDITAALVTAVAQVDGLVVVTFDAALATSEVAAVVRRISISPATDAAINALEDRVAALETK